MHVWSRSHEQRADVDQQVGYSISPLSELSQLELHAQRMFALPGAGALITTPCPPHSCCTCQHHRRSTLLFKLLPAQSSRSSSTARVSQRVTVQATSLLGATSTPLQALRPHKCLDWPRIGHSCCCIVCNLISVSSALQRHRKSHKASSTLPLSGKYGTALVNPC